MNHKYSIDAVGKIATMQSSAAALVSSAKAKGGDDAAHKIADRAFLCETIIGTVIVTLRFVALSFILPFLNHRIGSSPTKIFHWNNNCDSLIRTPFLYLATFVNLTRSSRNWEGSCVDSILLGPVGEWAMIF